MSAFIQKDVCTPMLTAALFTIAKLWKQPKYLLIDEWIKKMWYIYVYTQSFGFFYLDILASLNSVIDTATNPQPLNTDTHLEMSQRQIIQVQVQLLSKIWHLSCI